MFFKSTSQLLKTCGQCKNFVPTRFLFVAGRAVKSPAHCRCILASSPDGEEVFLRVNHLTNRAEQCHFYVEEVPF